MSSYNHGHFILGGTLATAARQMSPRWNLGNPPASIYCDSGSTDNHASGLFNRSTGGHAYPDITRAIVNAAR